MKWNFKQGKIAASSGIYLALILGGGYFVLNSSIDISYRNSTQIGDEVVVQFPSWTSEDLAKRSFQINPRIEGELVWLDEFHELRFVPTLGFDPLVTYRARVNFISPLLATPLPAGNTTSFKASSTSSERKEKESVYEPIYLEGRYIDINLDTMILTLFENGNAVNTFPVGAKGNPWKTPTRQGKFKVRSKELRHWSTIYHLWMPYSINFSGDYFIHAWPSWPNGQRVNSLYSGGCIRLHDGDIEKVFEWAEIGMPLVVHSTPDVRAVISSEGVHDGDLVRENSDYRVYIVKEVEEKQFKRHVPSEQMAKWYPHLEPFWRRIKIVSDGTLTNYQTSRWVRTARPPDSFLAWDIYEIDDLGVKHRFTCKDALDCSRVWTQYGWEPHKIYTINEQELEFYQTGEDKELQISPTLVPLVSPVSTSTPPAILPSL